jgi:hypothetical protein
MVIIAELSQAELAMRRRFASEVALDSFQQCVSFLAENLGRMETGRVQHPQVRVLGCLGAWVLGDDDIIYGLDGNRIVERRAVLADLPLPRYLIACSEPIPAARGADLVADQPDFA